MQMSEGTNKEICITVCLTLRIDKHPQMRKNIYKLFLSLKKQHAYTQMY